MALFDPSRLYTQLQNTQLQNKDQPLFQLINQMIGAMVAINKLQNASSGGGGGSSSTVISQIIQQLNFGLDSGDGEQGFPGAQGIDGEDGANGMVPYYIAPTEEFTVPEFKQALFAMNIDNEGSLIVDGFLIEVDGVSDSDCCNRAFPIIFPDSYESSENGYPPGNPDVAVKGGINAFVGTNSFANNPIDLLVGQIKFPGTQNPSANVNTLDDYEEGTWTPTISFAVPGDLAVTYSIRVGTWTKVGDTIRAAYTIITSAFTYTTASGNFIISGLPLVSANVTNNFAFSMHHFGGITAVGYTQCLSQLPANASQFTLTLDASAAAPIAVTSTQIPTGGAIVAAGVLVYQATT